MIGWLKHRLIVSGWRRPRTPAELADMVLHRGIQTALKYAAQNGGGIERFVLAGEMMVMDDLVHNAHQRASAYVIEGKTIQASRMLAVQDMSKTIRAQLGYEVAKEFRARVMSLPIMLLLSEEAIQAVNKRLSA